MGKNTGEILLSLSIVIQILRQSYTHMYCHCFTGSRTHTCTAIVIQIVVQTRTAIVIQIQKKCSRTHTCTAIVIQVVMHTHVLPFTYLLTYTCTCISCIKNEDKKNNNFMLQGLGFRCLMPLSTIFQLHRGALQCDQNTRICELLL